MWWVCLVLSQLALLDAFGGDGVKKEGEWWVERWNSASEQSCTTHCVKHKLECNQVLIDNGTCLLVGSKFNLFFKFLIFRHVYISCNLASFKTCGIFMVCFPSQKAWSGLSPTRNPVHLGLWSPRLAPTESQSTPLLLFLFSIHSLLIPS